LSRAERPAFDRELLEQIVQAIPHVGVLGLKVTEIDVGRALARIDWRDDLVGDPGTGVLHGGVLTTVVDTVSGLAVMSRVTEVMQIATLDLRIDYLRPARPRLPVFAEATCYRLSRSVAFVRARAYQEGGDDVAASLATFMLQSSSLPAWVKTQGTRT